MILAGIDEAGYGPTLGPLVISVSVFRVPGTEDRSRKDEIPDLWKALRTVVTRKPDGSRVAVDDSKRLFSQKKGLRTLEEGVLPFICLKYGAVPRDLRSLLAAVARRATSREDVLAPSPDRYLEDYPWYEGRNVGLPADTFSNVVEKRAEALQAALGAAQVELLGIASWLVDVLEFNQGLGAMDNKSLVSFEAVSAFIRRIWRQFPREEVEVFVDRQGGRMHYARALFESVKPKSIRIETETDDLSVYELRRGGIVGPPKPFRVTFATECEGRCLPVALGSMLSKYLREVHMLLFNRFWRDFRADLRPTAGYALDARRFLRDIEPLRARLGIDPATLVRQR